MSAPRITGVCAGAISPDGSEIEIEFQGADGFHLRAGLTAGALEHVVGRLHQLLTESRNRRHPTTGHLEIHVLEAVAATAAPAAGADRVVLILRTDNGMVHRFALSSELSGALRPEMRRAETAAKEQSEKPKH